MPLYHGVALKISRLTLLHGGKSSVSQFDRSVREGRKANLYIRTNWQKARPGNYLVRRTPRLIKSVTPSSCAINSRAKRLASSGDDPDTQVSGLDWCKGTFSTKKEAP